jgi:hypothetical protein
MPAPASSPTRKSTTPLSRSSPPGRRQVSALIGTDPLLSMEAGPADAHEFVTCCAASRSLFDAAW